MFQRFRQSFQPKQESVPEPAPAPTPAPASRTSASPLAEAIAPAPAPMARQAEKPISKNESAKQAEVKASATPRKPPIDWKEALNQVGNDRDFLNEVLQDLLDEAKTAEDDIATAITAQDFGGVMRAAHRIKGSASYLSCEPLRDISYILQQSGHEGEDNPTNGNLFQTIEEQFREFRLCVKYLREAIANGVPE